MAFSEDLVGREVYARDGSKIGRAKRLLYGGEYVLLGRPLATDIVVPLKAVESSESRLLIPFTLSYLDDAPHIDPERELTPSDEALLDDFYMPRAA